MDQLTPCRPKAIPREEVVCSICLDILTFPVTLPCGHNFDRGCVFLAWKYQVDEAEQLDAGAERHLENRLNSRSLSCPLCRATWRSHSMGQALHINKLLQLMVQQLFPEEPIDGANETEKESQVSFEEFFRDNQQVLDQELPNDSSGDSSTAESSSTSSMILSPNGDTGPRSTPPSDSHSSALTIPLSIASASLAQPPGYFLTWLVLLVMLTMIATPTEWLACIATHPVNASASNDSSLVALFSPLSSSSSSPLTLLFGRWFAAFCDEVGNWIEALAEVVDLILPYVQFLEMIF